VPERPAPRGYERPPQENQNYVPDHAARALAIAKGDRS
ncbi:MAG: polyphosphate kinase 2, partial [Glycomyces artemisiae]|nr:polyphosphate kinase 2 [Glycomyces artemisiae]